MLFFVPKMAVCLLVGAARMWDNRARKAKEDAADV
jgi:hypothetical protein